MLLSFVGREEAEGEMREREARGKERLVLLKGGRTNTEF